MVEACAVPPLSVPVIAEAMVTSNPEICREHRRLTFSLREFPRAEPGQFVHLIHPLRSAAPIPWHGSEDQPEWSGPHELFDELTVRRAFSIAGLRSQGDQTSLDVIYRVVGRGTLWMASLKRGDSVNVLGPLGNRFVGTPRTRLALLVGGGVGLPPLLWWSEHLARLGIETIVFIGAQSRDLVPLTLSSAPSAKIGQAIARALDLHGVTTVFSTDDGSLGHHGYITEALEEWVTQRRPRSDQTCIYACGPEPMMRRAAELAEQWDMDCQLCMERSMACGIGTCQSCVVPVHDPRAADGWRYKLCCTDGPVFDGREIVWD